MSEVIDVKARQCLRELAEGIKEAARGMQKANVELALLLASMLAQLVQKGLVTQSELDAMRAAAESDPVIAADIKAMLGCVNQSEDENK